MMVFYDGSLILNVLYLLIINILKMYIYNDLF